MYSQWKREIVNRKWIFIDNMLVWHALTVMILALVHEIKSVINRPFPPSARPCRRSCICRAQRGSWSRWRGRSPGGRGWRYIHWRDLRSKSHYSQPHCPLSQSPVFGHCFGNSWFLKNRFLFILMGCFDLKLTERSCTRAEVEGIILELSRSI